MGSVPAYDISRLRILVLERHTLLRSMLAHLFQEFGVPKVHDTDDPDTAYDMFKQLPIDMVLSDWSPGLDGMEFLRNVRQAEDSPNPYVPLIVITANTELHHIYTARDTGMTEYLAKPVSARLLYSRIVSCIQNHRQFIRTPDYLGPDRRRRSKAAYLGAERRKVA